MWRQPSISFELERAATQYPDQPKSNAAALENAGGDGVAIPAPFHHSDQGCLGPKNYRTPLPARHCGRCLTRRRSTTGSQTVGSAAADGCACGARCNRLYRRTLRVRSSDRLLKQRRQSLLQGRIAPTALVAPSPASGTRHGPKRQSTPGAVTPTRSRAVYCHIKPLLYPCISTRCQPCPPAPFLSCVRRAGMRPCIGSCTGTTESHSLASIHLRFATKECKQ